MLEHTYRWAFDRGYPATFWSPRFFYPSERALTYSENLIGAAPLYWLLRTFLAETPALYAWLWAMFALNYAAMSIVLRWLGIHPILAALGAFLFAFAAPRQVQAFHLTVAPQVLAPFALYYGWRFTRLPDRRSFVLLVSAAVGQLFMSIQLGWFLGVSLLIWIALLLVTGRDARRRLAAFMWARKCFIGITVVAAALPAAAFFRNYYLGNLDARRSYIEAAHHCPTAADWLTQAPGYLWSDRQSLADSPSEPERQLFAGLAIVGMLLASFLVGWRFHFSRVGSFCLSTAAAAGLLMLLTLDFGAQTSLWYFVYHSVPGANSIRGVMRVWTAVLPLALFGGLAAVQFLGEKWLASPRARLTAYTLLASLCLVEQVDFAKPSWPETERGDLSRRLSRQLVDADAVFVVSSAAAGVESEWHETAAMWAGLWSGIPVLNGQSGRTPDGHPTASGGEDPLPQVLHRLGPNWSGRLLIVRLGPPPRRAWYQVDPPRHATLIREEAAADK